MRARFAIVLFLACSRTESTTDAGGADGAITPSFATKPPDAEPATPPPPPIVGTWERRTEPYQGMRIEIRIDKTSEARVTEPPPVTTERLSAGITKAHLECQKSLWKANEILVSNVHRAGDDFEGEILIRDWGLTAGICRHADSRSPAHLALSTTGDLTITVTRGKTVTQTWARVSR